MKRILEFLTDSMYVQHYDEDIDMMVRDGFRFEFVYGVGLVLVVLILALSM